MNKLTVSIFISYIYIFWFYYIFWIYVCLYIFIYLNTRKENTKNRDGKFIHSRRALVTHGARCPLTAIEKQRGRRWQRMSAIQDNSRNENQCPKVAVVPFSATRPCRFVSLRRGRVSRNSCVDERGRRFSIIGRTRRRDRKERFCIGIRNVFSHDFSATSKIVAFRNRYQIKKKIKRLVYCARNSVDMRKTKCKNPNVLSVTKLFKNYEVEYYNSVLEFG